MTSPAPRSGHGHGPELLGTRLRHLLELVDGGVAEVYRDLGLEGFRPRFTPIVRAVADSGPCSIRALAETIGVTHSAMSQTVAQMTRDGLVVLAPSDTDARARIVRLTAKAESLLPTLDAEWRATSAAAAELESELSFPLSRLLDEAFDALRHRPMRRRVAEATPGLIEHYRVDGDRSGDGGGDCDDSDRNDGGGPASL